MRRAPLLNRGGEVALAKRFERGHMRALKAISRSPIVIQEIIRLGTELEEGMRSIRHVVAFDEEEITDSIVAARLADTIKKIDEIKRDHEMEYALAAKLKEIDQTRGPKQFGEWKWTLLLTVGLAVPTAARAQKQKNPCS